MAIFSDKVRMYARFITFMFPYLGQLIMQKIRASIHRRTYKGRADAKTVVIIGGSFAGWFTAQRLIQSLPTGYKVVLIEKNEHLHYVFNFPRFSVLQGKERTAFIPYDGLDKMAVKGIYERKQATAKILQRNKVVLDNGEELDFAYCVIATGASQPFPGRLTTTATADACAELRRIQKGVESAHRVAVVGSGAVGVEMATDIKAYYPDKDVTLLSSRDYLLPGFGSKLRDKALEATKAMGVNVVLSARPKVKGESGSELLFADGHVEEFDLVVSSAEQSLSVLCLMEQIPCTGQMPNSSIIGDISPSSISKTNGRILVKQNLQLEDAALPHIFAIGDVAETGGPRMARAGFYQANIVADNVLASINGRDSAQLKIYKPDVGIEAAIKLTLGKVRSISSVPRTIADVDRQTMSCTRVMRRGQSF